MLKKRIEDLIVKSNILETEKNYKQLVEDPDNSRPMIIVNTPVVELPTWKERIASPEKMLEAELLQIERHLEIGDDHLPNIRTQFGTGQVASAFGSPIHYYDDNFPAAGEAGIKESKDIANIEIPSLDAGLYKKVKEYTDFYLENLPKGVKIQHPDIQSPFNTAHLIRGDKVFFDFYDDPEALNLLLDKITDYMIKLVPYLRKMVGENSDWFYDWGAYWKGTARISNCSMQMIGTDLYLKHVLPRDERLLKTLGGGRMHYCGREGSVINEFLNNPNISALDYDNRFHDIWELSELARKDLVLFTNISTKSKAGERLLSGDWPSKKNLVIVTEAKDLKEGKEILKKIKDSI